MNCWKSIGKDPVAQWPMAVCDASSVKEGDLIPRTSPENGNTIYNVLPSSNHAWYVAIALSVVQQDVPVLARGIL
jgi:hypothetical protein